MEHLQRVRHANRGRLLLRTPGPVPLWDLQYKKRLLLRCKMYAKKCSNVETNIS